MEVNVLTLTRWSPARDFAALEIDRLNRMFGATATWLPPVDIYETADHDVVVKLEVPDVKREDISLTLEDNVLTVAGERKAPANVKDDEYRRRERTFGSFSRSFTLPNSVDGGRVQAAYADGVLTITLPQRAEAKPRQIAIEG
jgi:HSP20 family protein